MSSRRTRPRPRRHAGAGHRRRRRQIGRGSGGWASGCRLFAIDPLRGADIAFTAPYVVIEGFYMVRDDSPVRSNAQVDVATNRVVVGKGSAYDLFLTRALQQAQIVRAPTSTAVVSTFLDSGAEIAAGVKQQLELDGVKAGGLRLLDKRFMVIQQAMGVPKTRGSRAAQCLSGFIEAMKSSGFIADALQRHGIQGAAVAPPGQYHGTCHPVKDYLQLLL